ncbi:MAG: ABC transporter ATP-binding protein [Lachnospira sp.]
MAKAVLEVDHLRVNFKINNQETSAIEDVTFKIEEGMTLGVVGESGCGKSVTATSIMGLLPPSVGKIAEGKIILDGQELTAMKPDELRKIRGDKISMIFQEPMTSLNPVYTIEKQLTEMIMSHKKMSRKEAFEKGVEMLEKVGIPSPRQRMKEYPHQLSGGMRQRVMIAMALSCDPLLLIADEPTTALDVTIQAQILDLMLDLKKKMNTVIMLITHDMGVVAEVADYVMVMYAGKVVEYADVRTIFKNPKHPYTVGLLKSIPRLDQDVAHLYTIEGTVPSLTEMPKGCRFSTRCKECMEKCKNEDPGLVDVDGAKVRCWKYHQ